MNPPNPSPLTRSHDEALNEARAALNGLTTEQKVEVVAALMLRFRLFGAGEIQRQAMEVAAVPKEL